MYIIKKVLTKYYINLNLNFWREIFILYDIYSLEKKVCIYVSIYSCIKVSIYSIRKISQ